MWHGLRTCATFGGRINQGTGKPGPAQECSISGDRLAVTRRWGTLRSQRTELAMSDYSSTVGLAVVSDVSRIGADVVLLLRNAVRGIRLRYNGRVTLIGVTHIESVDLRNDLVPRELEPGWTISDLTFEAGTARLGVFKTDMHDRYPVLHSITCRDVQVRMRLVVLVTLRNAVVSL